MTRVKRLPAAVAGLLEPETYRLLRQRAQALKNRAVFEILAILDKIFARTAPLEYQLPDRGSYDRR